MRVFSESCRQRLVRIVEQSAQDRASREMERILSRLEKSLKPLKTHPGHAGAVFEGLVLVKDALNLLEELNSSDSRAQRSLHVTMSFWVRQESKEQSNEWFKETGKYLQGFPTAARKLLEMALGAQSQAEVLSVEGMRVRNLTGVEGAADDLLDILREVAAKLRKRGMGKLLRGDLRLVRDRQLPVTAGHAGAIYRAQHDDISVVWPPYEDREMVERLTHEFGHRLWTKFFSSNQREVWTLSRGSVQKYITRYAATEPKEDFAEVFAHWVLGKPLGEHRKRMKSVLARD